MMVERLVVALCFVSYITYAVTVDCIKEERSRYSPHNGAIVANSMEDCWKKCQKVASCFKAAYDPKRLGNPAVNCFFHPFEAKKDIGFTNDFTAFICKTKCTIQKTVFVTDGSNNIINPSCTSTCKCALVGGRSECVSLCPIAKVKCGNITELVNYKSQVPNTKCTCNKEICLKPEVTTFIKNKGDSKKLFCLVSKLSWTFNNKLIVAKKKKYEIDDKSLTIHNLTHMDSGVYTCGDNKKYQINVLAEQTKDDTNGMSTIHIAIIAAAGASIFVIVVVISLLVRHRRRPKKTTPPIQEVNAYEGLTEFNQSTYQPLDCVINQPLDCVIKSDSKVNSSNERPTEQGFNYENVTKPTALYEVSEESVETFYKNNPNEGSYEYITPIA